MDPTRWRHRVSVILPSLVTGSSAGLLPDPGHPEVPVYLLWSVCLSALRKSPPTSLDELMDIVNQYADKMEEEEIKKTCKNTRLRVWGWGF
jgi:hypothetical protein